MAAYPVHRAALAALVLVFSGCSARYEFSDVEIAKAAMVGLSSQDVRMCAGFPDRTVSEDGFTVWSYEADRPGNGLTVSTPVLFGSANTALNVSSAGNCRMQVRFRDGRVDRVAYAGDNDGPRGRDTLCTPLVDGCIAYARRFKAGDTKAMASLRASDDSLVTGSLPAAADGAPAAEKATDAGDSAGAGEPTGGTAAADAAGTAGASAAPASSAPSAGPKVEEAVKPVPVVPLRLRPAADD